MKAVKRTEVEKAVVEYLIPAVNKAKNEIEQKLGIKMEVSVDWWLGKEYCFEDETRRGIGG